WFGMIDGQQAGPMSRAEFALRFAADVVDEETYVWKEGMGEWLPASQVRDLAGIFHAREQAKSQGVKPPPPPEAARKRKAKPVESEEQEVELDLDVNAFKPLMRSETPGASAKAPPPAAPQKARAQDYSLAAPRSRP